MAGSVVIPPVNFELVAPGVYRSGFPTRRNIEFLNRLGLRSVLRLSVRDKKYSPEVAAFFADSGVRIIDCMTEGNREPFGYIDARAVRRALAALSAVRRRPILMHCLNGQQTTGCIVGLLRKAEGWCLSAIFDEYRRHVSGGRVNALDLQLIELWPVERATAKSRAATAERDDELDDDELVSEARPPASNEAAGDADCDEEVEADADAGGAEGDERRASAEGVEAAPAGGGSSPTGSAAAGMSGGAGQDGRAAGMPHAAELCPHNSSPGDVVSLMADAMDVEIRRGMSAGLQVQEALLDEGTG